LAVLHDHSDNTAALASAVGGNTLDIFVSWIGQGSAGRFETWSCIWRERTRGGDISVSSGSSRGLALPCRRRLHAHGCGQVASGPSALVGVRVRSSCRCVSHQHGAA
jgi:hypothetical protein